MVSFEFESEMHAAPRELDDLVRRLFCSQTGRYGNYKLLDGGIEVFPDTLYQYQIFDRDGSYLLQLYPGIEDIGGQFWEQEIRTLMRLGRIGHPALPTIRHGAFDDKEDLAFVISDRAEATLRDRGEMEYLRREKIEALWWLGILADALTTLHLHGIQHRNLWQGTIERYKPQDRERGFRLARFEMSTLFASLFRDDDPDADESNTRAMGDQIRNFNLEQGRQALSCLAPERLEALAADSQGLSFVDVVHSSRSDVFSLGVIAAQWFGEAPPDQDALAGIYDGGDINVNAAEAFLRSLRRSLRPAELPKDLRQLLEDMLATEPSDRPDAKDVCNQVSQNYGRWLEAWRPAEGRNRLIGFLPDVMGEMLHNDFQLVTHPPTTREGKDETIALIEEDVAGQSIVYSPDGFEPFSTGNTKPPMRDAKYVLLGQRAAWFCDLSRPDGPAGDPWNEVLLAKYVARANRESRGKIGELYKAPFRQSIGNIEVVPVDINNREFLNRLRRDRPDWQPLLQLTHFTNERPADHVMMEWALSFLLTFFRVELDARYYPFTCAVPGAPGDTVELVEDEARWTNRVMRADSALFSFYVNGRGEGRAYLGDFFTSPSTYDDGAWEVTYFHDSNGFPERRLGRGVVRRSGGSFRLSVEITEGAPMPSAGWLAPAADYARREDLKRQALALSDLCTMRSLVAQFIKPWTTRLLKHNWEGAGKGLEDKTGTVANDQTGKHFVQELLACEPFYALHGPPGTGKTTVVANAIVERLEREPTARILVSAQSNFALDNLGERITKLLKGRRKTSPHLDDAGMVLRVSSDASREKISPPMQKYRIGALTAETAKSIKENCEKVLNELKGQEELSKIVSAWRDRVESNTPDLRERVRKGANIVLATCSQATRAITHRRMNESEGIALTSADQFDWVIIEEAAKAWPTEVAVPLVRGFRWTLVGDHKQLPAHRLTDINRFLAKCEGHRDAEISRHGARRPQYMRWFELFRRLLEDENAVDQKPQGDRKLREAQKPQDGQKPQGDQKPRGVNPVNPPIGRMTVQYRMREPIAEVISNAFYKKPPLQTHVSLGNTYHGIIQPGFLANGGALYWLDTSEPGGYDEDTNWENKGEAALVRDLLYRIEPFPDERTPPFSDTPLAVVSPYRAQNKLLEKYLSGEVGEPSFPVSDARRKQVAALVPQKLVHSVHSIQGREADVVIASLVRTGRGGDTVFSALGHVAQETLVNVLFSRARLLLILVGQFQFFQGAAKRFPTASFWGDVCNSVLQHGQKVSAEDLYTRSAAGNNQ